MNEQKTNWRICFNGEQSRKRRTGKTNTNMPKWIANRQTRTTYIRCCACAKLLLVLLNFLHVPMLIWSVFLSPARWRGREKMKETNSSSRKVCRERKMDGNSLLIEKQIHWDLCVCSHTHVHPSEQCSRLELLVFGCMIREFSSIPTSHSENW